MRRIHTFVVLSLLLALPAVAAAEDRGAGRLQASPGLQSEEDGQRPVSGRHLGGRIAQDPGRRPQTKAIPGGLPLRTPIDDIRDIIASGHSVARVWNETLLAAIRTDRPKPPAHARNLFHTAIAMWDAWAAYDKWAKGYISTEKYTADDVEAARAEAISYAAHRLLVHRFPGGGYDPIDFGPCQPGAAASQLLFEQVMLELGYDPAFTDTTGDSPAAVGNRIGQAVIDYGLSDGANEGADLCYPDDSDYYNLWLVNQSLPFKLPGTSGSVNDPNRWQPLAFDFLILQNGIVIGQALQSYAGIGWADVKAFGGSPADNPPPQDPLPCGFNGGSVRPHPDPGCAPQLGGLGDDVIKAAMAELIAFNASVDPFDGRMIDISPSVHGNNTLGHDDGTGHPINPYTGQPYPPNVVPYGDWARVIAEFWADGPASETPPGHWNVLANYVTDHPDLGPKRIGGKGPVVNDLEWDVKLYLAIDGAVHDAAVGAWGTKHYYDSSRPITLIRYMAEQGQSSDPSLPRYSPLGLPLVPGLIEMITPESSAPGERHYDLRSHVNEIAIRAWNGGPDDPTSEIGGVGWRLAIDWITYQKATFVTPPFPGYTSGHSTFSRAGAEVLAAFTGNEYFPGGLGTYTAYQNDYLQFEEGPSQTVQLEWATYFDASDEAGISRRYGGIHPFYDDYPGRIQGSEVGKAAFKRALEYYNGPPRNDSLVTICHTKGKGTATLEVAPPALAAHLAHGDTLGACGD